MVLLEGQDIEVFKAYEGQWDHGALRDQTVDQEFQDREDRRDLQAEQGFQDLRGHEAVRDSSAEQDDLGLQDLVEALELQGQEDVQVHQVLLVHQAHQVLKCRMWDPVTK